MLEPVLVWCGSHGHALVLRARNKVIRVYRVVINDKNQSLRTEKAAPELQARALKKINCR